MRPASWFGGQSSWLLNMRSRVRFPTLPCEFLLERGRRPWWPWSGQLVEIRFKAPPGTSDSPLNSPSFSSGQRNRAYWASHPQKSVTLQPQPGEGGRPRSLRGHVVALEKKTCPYDVYCTGLMSVPLEMISFTGRLLTTKGVWLSLFNKAETNNVRNVCVV